MSEAHDRSLPEVHGSVAIPKTGSWLRRLIAFAGPAYLVSVGYMDPGNWATDIAGGARFGYQLVWVLLMSNLMAVLLQTLAARLGVVTGSDLAQACRDAYPRWVVMPLWILCELAIVACDLAEVLGAAIGLHLLTGIPLFWGVMITALDVLLLLALSRFGMRMLEAVIITLVATIGVCFAIEMFLSRPDVPAILASFLPRDSAGHPSLFARQPGGGLSVLGLNGESLYVAMGILGATVMPHNLYLHSALVQSRASAATLEGKRDACRMNLVDTVVALNAALFVNGAILVLAAATFHGAGHENVAGLAEAHGLLAPLLGTSLASTVFAIALLSSGQSSTITGTLAGQIVMEGFVRIRVRPWLRRLISRGLAIVPAALVIGLRGEQAVDSLLVLSQVVLSMQLSFAVVPLVVFTSDRRRMGEFANPAWVKALAIAVVVVIAGLNGKLVVDTVGGWAAASPGAWWVWGLALPLAAGLGLLLAYVALAPWLERRWPALLPEAAAAVHAIGSRIREEAGHAAEALHLGEPHAAPASPSPPSPLALQALGHRRIAIALERGRADRSVLEFLRSLEFQPGTELVFLHVVESAASRYLGEQSRDEEVREDEAALRVIAVAFASRGVQASVRLGHGDAKSEIARIVNEVGADLLVTGSHGHRGLHDVVYGATVSGVRHLVRCPVLTVPPTG
ncbi:MAG: Nramp family divalent metal transporter [Candidatus Eisenbacteria bacterium]|nr:Nramp family divalent metal transporter [Candidatus Eisenbacteria bacterium]